MPKNKKWQDISTAAKLRIAVVGVIQIALLGAALWDLRKQPAKQINGPKKMWYGLVFVNFVGPIAYFLVGRKQGARSVLGTLAGG